MASKKLGILAGSALAGTLLLGTAGLVAAQDPTATPSPTVEPGMMSGQAGQGMMNGAGMMSGQAGQGMMNGAGMMSGQIGHGMMTPDMLEQMDELHDQMVASGVIDQARMQELHAQHHPGSTGSRGHMTRARGNH